MDSERDDRATETKPSADTSSPVHRTPSGPPRRGDGARTFPFGILGLGLGAVVAYAYARLAGYG